LPVHGDAGDPLQPVCGGVAFAGVEPIAQIGHGWVGMPVRIVAELSWKFHVASPVAVLSVPLGATGENVFVTHTERPAFEIGNGVPNRHPTVVQSTPAGRPAAGIGPMLQFVPVQGPSENRLVAPDGVELSGTCEMPPPSDSPPHCKSLSGIVAPRSRKLFPHVPVADVDWKSKSSVVGGVEVVVDDVVELLVELDVEVELLVDDDVDVLLDVDDEVLELVEVELLVVTEVDVLLEVDDDVLVLLEVDDEVLLLVEVELLVVTDVDVLLEVELLVDVDDDVLVEEDVVDDVLLEVELDVLEVVVVVVAFGLQRGSSGPNSGTAAWSVQSVLNSVTQSTQFFKSSTVTMAPVQLDGVPSKGLPYGHVAGKPIAATATSPLPSHSLSPPPHALQMAVTFFVSALLRSSAVLPVASTGQVVP
jgi:hypothetical protein